MKNIIKIFAYLLLGISLLLLFFSLNFINKWNKQNNQISKQLDEINDLVKIEKVEDNENTIVKDESSTLKNNSLNNVDFSELRNKNSDVVGWIDVKGTNINYPFVQHIHLTKNIMMQGGYSKIIEMMDLMIKIQ